MENYPQSFSINMQPYSRNGGSTTPTPPATSFGQGTSFGQATSFGQGTSFGQATSFGQTEPTPVSTQPPKDFVLWSFFNAMYCNPFCLGFLALVFSIKARDRTVAKDLMAANSYGRTARSLNIAALCLGIVATIILVVLLAVLYRPVYP